MRYVCIITAAVQLCACSGTNRTLVDDVALSESESNLLREGIALFNEGNYGAAFDTYQRVLETAPSSAEALYETALVLNSLGEFGRSQEYVHRGLLVKSPIRHLFQHLRGINADMLGNVEEAERALTEGIADNDRYYPLHYSLGIVKLEQNKPLDARHSFENALRVNPNHASSHLALAQTNVNLNERLFPLLGYTYFLLLEPDSPRSLQATREIRSILSSASKRDSEGNVTIGLNLGPSDESTNPLSAVELIIGLSSAARLLPENADKAEIDHIVDQYQHIFTVVAELETKHSTPGFAWDLYTPFTTALHNDGHTETLVHLIMRSSDLEGVEAWLSTHEQEVDSLEAWLTSNALSTE